MTDHDQPPDGFGAKGRELTAGHPSHSLAPLEILKSAYTSYLSSGSAHEGLCYGPDEGPPETQTAIAQWLGNVYSLEHPPTA